MPVPDPIPPLGPVKKRFLSIMRAATLFALAIAALAVALVARGDTQAHIHMLIATALGVGLTALLGIGLMSLTFLSNRGREDDAANFQESDRE